MKAPIPLPALRLEDLDFDLPAALVAERPPAQRDACNLLRLRRTPRSIDVYRFADLPALLRPGDLLVRNTSRVIPARLAAWRADTRGRCELLLVEPDPGGGWWVLARPARALVPPMRLHLADQSEVQIVTAGEGPSRLVKFAPGTDVLGLAERLGAMPLPPYIRRAAEAGDRESYQTVYARQEGSVAAPTAGLHFTPALFDALADRGIDCVDLVLHIGPGTFAPLRSEDPRRHPMHWERFEVERRVLERCARARATGGRVIAVGTTAARVLVSVALWQAGEAAGSLEIEDTGAVLRGRTRLLILPPYAFRAVHVLLTNFHLPRSTLLLLVDAFAGREAIRAAYAEAVARQFRFFSYGDAMMIE